MAIIRPLAAGVLNDQSPIIASDPRQTTERLIRGVVAIASGSSAESLLPFKQQGLTDKLTLLRLPEVQFKQTVLRIVVEQPAGPSQ